MNTVNLLPTLTLYKLLSGDNKKTLFGRQYLTPDCVQNQKLLLGFFVHFRKILLSKGHLAQMARNVCIKSTFLMISKGVP